VRMWTESQILVLGSARGRGSQLTCQGKPRPDGFQAQLHAARMVILASFEGKPNRVLTQPAAQSAPAELLPEADDRCRHCLPFPPRIRNPLRKGSTLPLPAQTSYCTAVVCGFSGSVRFAFGVR
jgi:hypothetical protein